MLWIIILWSITLQVGVLPLSRSPLNPICFGELLPVPHLHSSAYFELVFLRYSISEFRMASFSISLSQYFCGHHQRLSAVMILVALCVCCFLAWLLAFVLGFLVLLSTGPNHICIVTFVRVTMWSHFNSLIISLFIPSLISFSAVYLILGRVLHIFIVYFFHRHIVCVILHLIFYALCYSNLIFRQRWISLFVYHRNYTPLSVFRFRV